MLDNNDKCAWIHIESRMDSWDAFYINIYK